MFPGRRRAIVTPSLTNFAKMWSLLHCTISARRPLSAAAVLVSRLSAVYSSPWVVGPLKGIRLDLATGVDLVDLIGAKTLRVVVYWEGTAYIILLWFFELRVPAGSSGCAVHFFWHSHMFSQPARVMHSCNVWLPDIDMSISSVHNIDYFWHRMPTASSTSGGPCKAPSLSR